MSQNNFIDQSNSGSTVDTELPAAAAAADNTANPTAPAVLAFGMSYDGSTWDRMRGDSNDGLLVNLGANNDITVTSGTVTSLTQMNGAAISMGTGVRDAGTQRVTIATNDAVPVTFTGSTDVATQTTLNSALTSLQLIDDTVFIDDTATHSTGSTKGIGIMATATPTDANVDANDIGMVAMTTARQLKVDASGVAVPVTDNSASLSVDWNGTQPVTGSGTATGALRVELANNGTGLVGLNAGTNGIGKLTANSGVTIGAVEIAAAQTLATVTTVSTLTGTTTLTPGTGASNLGKAEDAAHTTADVGVMALAVRESTPTDLSVGATNGDYEPLQVSATGELWVNMFPGATNPAKNEDVAAVGADTLMAVAQIRNDTPIANASVSGDGDYTQFRADNFGKTWVTATVNEDVAHIAAEPITANGARRIDPLASSAGSDGDWATLNQSAEGALYATLAPTTASGLSVANFTSGDSFTALTNTAQVIKASAGNLYGYYMYNPNASATYVMVYNVAQASVTVGTTNPTLVFAIPATSGANMMFPYPISFSNAGWSCAAATTGGGNSAPASALEVMFFYK